MSDKIQRTPLVMANWKMNFSVSDALKFAMGFEREFKVCPDDVEVVFIPSFVALYPMIASLEETGFKIGAQDLFWEERGNFTGEVSGKDLKEMEVEFVLIGHSERRHLLGETDRQVAKKLQTALDAGLKPVLCVGETADQRNGQKTFEVLETQLRLALEDKTIHVLENLVIAYEPVWAIGTGNTASPTQAQEVQHWIRNFLTKKFDAPFANRTRILYGGSVDPAKAPGLTAQPDIDGFLVGGASLDPKKFADIVRTIGLKST